MENGLIIENGIVKSGKDCEGVVEIPAGVTEIAKQAFYQNRKITGIIIPEGVTKIGSYSVNGCQALGFIEVPASVVSLGDDALVKRIDTNWTFNHTMDSKTYLPEIRCVKGSFVDEALSKMKEDDEKLKGGTHTNDHIFTVVYR